MVKNNIEVDVKVKLLEAGKTQQQLDALGYNIVLTYEKKD